ncbi:hypothetical protein GOV12_02225 [Candidatus Pacearchaeota archaeon]|nr:hypothetical protein [Candidatus Pacearchaeota archaeon]
MRSNSNRVLYVGIDESNHGQYPEFCAAVFSTNVEHIRPVRFPIERDFSIMYKFRKSSSVGYRLLVLNKKQIQESKSKMTVIAPKLILPYLDSLDYEPQELQILIDGGFFRSDVHLLKQGLEGSVERILCRGFENNKKRINKNNRRRKRKYNGSRKQLKREVFYVQPFIVGVTDIMVNNYFKKYQKEGSLDFLRENPHLVIF